MNNNLKTQKILTLKDIQSIKTTENKEKMVNALKFNPDIIATHENQEMQRYTGKNILVRQSVAKKLAQAARNLPSNYRLKIVFGYRHPSSQQKYFDRELTRAIKIYGALPTNQIYELVHPLIAVPEVAGHPTGGAVDVTIVSKHGLTLDMGTKISDFSDPSLLPTFSPKISHKIQQNRIILHDAMVKAGFAPFYGEWWHFSYGDREWAAFYNKAKSLYSQIDPLTSHK
jgi:D-alanyl-D-alanine dipeptidase